MVTYDIGGNGNQLLGLNQDVLAKLLFSRNNPKVQKGDKVSGSKTGGEAKPHIGSQAE
jgi:hypothetical protein